jgi:hypothetical protein
MDSNELKKLIRSEVVRLLEADSFNDNPDDREHPPEESSFKSKLMRSPGAPFGGNLYNMTGPVISNEARSLLMQWMRLVKAAWGRYGDPQNWPEKITKASQQLGQDFEDTVGSRGPTTNQYR